jgi:hypothetical protein
VDGCGYMWAVSRALEQARETIWILDCESTPLISSPSSRTAGEHSQPQYASSRH